MLLRFGLALGSQVLDLGLVTSGLYLCLVICLADYQCLQLAVWRSGSVVHRMNEVALCWARLVLGWVTIFGRVYHLGM